MGGRKKYAKYDYTKLTNVMVYDLVASGRIKKFPNGYMVPENVKEIIRELFLNRLKLGREEICKNISYQYLKKYYLGGTKRAFDYKIYNLVKYCFPEMNIKPWELKKVPNEFWMEKANVKEYMLWLAKKENINLTSVEGLKRFSAKLIQENFGSKALKYGGGLYNLVLLVAKCEIKEWQLIKVSVWTEKKVKEAVKWMIEEKLGWSHSEVVQNISAKVFYKHDLGGLLSKYCDHSPIRALQVAYPGEYVKVRNSRPEYLRKK